MNLKLRMTIPLDNIFLPSSAFPVCERCDIWKEMDASAREEGEGQGKPDLVLIFNPPPHQAKHK